MSYKEALLVALTRPGGFTNSNAVAKPVQWAILPDCEVRVAQLTKNVAQLIFGIPGVKLNLVEPSSACPNGKKLTLGRPKSGSYTIAQNLSDGID